MQQAREDQRVIVCRHCGKLMRVVRTPVDASGHAALMFRMTCLRCKQPATYAPEDIRAFAAPSATKSTSLID